MSATAEDVFVEREWTFRHRSITTEGKLGSTWSNHDGQTVVFGFVPKGAAPGTVWLVEVSEDGERARLKAARYTGRRVEAKWLDEWRLRNEAAIARDRNDRQLRKLAAPGDELDGLTLGEIRSLMLVSNRHDRAAILGVVLRELGAA